MEENEFKSLEVYRKLVENINSEGYTELELELLYLIENEKDFPVELLKKFAIDYIANSALLRKELASLFKRFETYQNKK
ncbi:MAG: hypothetical protein K0R31_2267 [Clostridiales bacterium]|nr:hypothetical protein [Clostridiales bacterium]MDF2986767.1 hypothetical protein [Eubacterium sp.]